jgi:integrase
VTENPVRGYDRRGIPEAKSHNRWLRQKEYERLLAACQQDNHRRFLILAVNTGMRHQELLKLHWDEVDLEAGLIDLPEDKSKNQEARTIPLTREALDTLRSTPEEGRTGWVFPGRIEGKPMNNLGKGWRTIRTRAKVKVRIHDLRHTFASWLAQRGVSEKAAQDLMGHKTSSMTKRYTHLSVDALKSAIATLNRDTVCDTVQVGEQMTE